MMRTGWYTLILAVSLAAAALVYAVKGGTSNDSPLAAGFSTESSRPEETKASLSPVAAAPAAFVPDSNFSGVLFIGDSRTLGLSEYGNLGNGEVFANSGMSVFRVFDDKETMKDGSTQSLEQVLSHNRFSAIYLMLGINELGYNRKSIMEQYKFVVDRIQKLQPGADLILEANLHVTGEKSSGSPTYNNENINALNQGIKQLAEDKNLYYIDANELFDDEKGNLNDKYSTDGSHVLGKYYSDWVEWIRKGSISP